MRAIQPSQPPIQPQTQDQTPLQPPIVPAQPAPQATTDATPSSTLGMPSAGPEAIPFDDEPIPYISNWQTFLLRAADTTNDSAVENMWRSFRHFVEGTTADFSPVLTQDQVNQIKQDNPGIDLPNGVRQEEANAIQTDFQERQLRDQLLEHRAPGIESGISGFLGQAVGTTITDPLSVAAGVMAPELIGLKAAEFGAGIGERAANLALRGATEGLGFGISQEGAKEIQKATFGDNLQPLQALSNLAQDAGFGTAAGLILHPIGQFVAKPFKKAGELLNARKFVSADASNDINNTAVSQMVQGKDVNVSVPMKQGFSDQIQDFHSEMQQNNITPEDMANALNSARETIENNINEVTNARNTLRDSIGDREPTPDEKNQLDGFDDQLTDLDQRLEAHEVLRFMNDNPDFSVSKDDIDDFINYNQNAEHDFDNGRGTETPDVVGAPIKDATSALNDFFPDDYVNELKNAHPLTDQDEDTFQNIADAPQRSRALSDAIDQFIKCKTGT